MADISGQVAVITGAGRGIGREIALHFARCGMHVVLNARTKTDLDSVAEECRELGAQAKVIPADICSPDAVSDLCHETLLAYGQVDVLVNNAAAFTSGTVADTKLQDFDRVVNTNLRGTFLVTKAFLPNMLDRSRGTIVMVSSTAGLRGDANGAIYAMTKFGIRGFAQSLFKEVRKQNIRVLTVFPSSVHTRRLDPDSFPAGGEGVPLTAGDVAAAITDAVALPNRALIHEMELWCTNP